MPTQLPNLGLNIGTQGETNWHIFVNENFEILDFNFIAPLSYDSSTKEVRVSLTYPFTGGTGSDSTSATSADEYLPGAGIAPTSTLESDQYVLMPIAGEATGLRIALTTAPGTSQSRTFKLRINGADSGIEVTISGTDTTGFDSSNTATIAAGDRITIESSTTSSTPAATKVAFGWVLTS